MVIEFNKLFKIFLAKVSVVYYPKHRKELEINRRIFNTLLIFFFSLVTFQINVYAAKQSTQDIAQEYRLKGYEAQQKGNLDEALSFYTKAISLGLEDPDVLNDIAVLYEQLGMVDKAEDQYLKIIKMDPGYSPVYSNLAYLYKNKGDLRKAAQFFVMRIEHGKPGDSWTIQAEHELEELAKRLPDLQDYLVKREAKKLALEVKKRAQREFYQKITLAKDHFQKAKDLEKQGFYVSAIDEYTRALSFTPNNPGIIRARKKAKLKWIQSEVKQHASSAMKWLELGDAISAKTEFRKILAIIPDESIQISE